MIFKNATRNIFLILPLAFLCLIPYRTYFVQNSKAVAQENQSIVTVPNSSYSGQLAFLGNVRLMNLENAQIAFREFGSGPTLILFPDRDQSMASWGVPFLKMLSSNYQVILVDYPGIGYSRMSPGFQFNFDNLVSMLNEFVLRLGQSQITFFGFGLGGQLSLAISEAKPAYLKKLVLVGTNVFSSLGNVLASPAGETLNNGNLNFFTWARSMFPSSPAGDLQFLNYWLFQNVIPPEPILPQMVSSEAAVEYQLSASNNIATNLSSISAPVLIVQGQFGYQCTISDANALVAGLSFATKATIQNAGDGLIFSNQKEFSQALNQFEGISTSS